MSTGTEFFQMPADVLVSCNKCHHLELLERYVPVKNTFVVRHKHKDYGDGDISLYYFTSGMYQRDADRLTPNEIDTLLQELDVDYDYDEDELEIICIGDIHTDLAEIEKEELT